MLESKDNQKSRKLSIKQAALAATIFGAGAVMGSQLSGKPETMLNIEVPMVQVKPVSEKVSSQDGVMEMLQSTNRIQFNQETGHVKILHHDGSLMSEIMPRDKLINVIVTSHDRSSVQLSYTYPTGGETLIIRQPFKLDEEYIVDVMTWEKPALDNRVNSGRKNP